MEDFKIRNLKLQITNLKLIIYRTVRIQLRRKKKKILLSTVTQHKSI